MSGAVDDDDEVNLLLYGRLNRDQDQQCRNRSAQTTRPNSRGSSFSQQFQIFGGSNQGKYQLIEHDITTPESQENDIQHKNSGLRPLIALCESAKGTVRRFNSAVSNQIGDHDVQNAEMCSDLRKYKDILERNLDNALNNSGSELEPFEMQMLVETQEELVNTLQATDHRHFATSHECNEDSDEYFVVYLSCDVLEEMRTSKADIDAYALEFAHLVSSAEPVPRSRSFKPEGVAEFFSLVLQGKTKVLGFNEFAYSDSGRLQGDDRLIEREYWVKVPGDPVRVIVHVHYQGRWSPFLNRRDRSLVTAVNLRHAIPQRGPTPPPGAAPVLREPCRALRQWRERHKFKVGLAGPAGPWDWRRDQARHPALHALLAEAERCGRRVRAVADPRALLAARRGGARHALIVAVDEYPPPVPRLGNPVRDGCNLEAALLEVGWEVRRPPPACFLVGARRRLIFCGRAPPACFLWAWLFACACLGVRACIDACVYVHAQCLSRTPLFGSSIVILLMLAGQRLHASACWSASPSVGSRGPAPS
jgi:hypothetical protein